MKKRDIKLNLSRETITALGGVAGGTFMVCSQRCTIDITEVVSKFLCTIACGHEDAVVAPEFSDAEQQGERRT